MRSAATALALLLGACAAADRGPSVVLVTIDGVRRQEVFGGADEALIGTAKPLRERFWRDTPEERREALLPFLWGTIAHEGVLLGEREPVRVLNPHRVSYPGYHEILSGFPADGIRDNAPVDNPNPTVLEWLHRRPGLRGSVEAWCSWERFRQILNPGRAGFPVFSGEPGSPPDAVDRLMLDLPPEWKGSVLDAFVIEKAFAGIRARKPRVIYLALGDTDEWAHAGRYERYLDAVRRSDAWLERLWILLQAMPEYRGRTTMLVTTDHGRGLGTEGWRHHQAKHAEAGEIWIAALGPGAKGTASDGPFTQGQVAATIAALLGESYRDAHPQAAPPLPLRP
jgi:hypothetical protein